MNNMIDVTRIPTEDSQAALRFCQALRRALDETDAPSKPCEISVVLAVFNESENLLTLHQQVAAALQSVTSSFQIVYVNDGSSDDSGAILDRLAHENPFVTVVHLARNFGQQAAFSAGLTTATGQAVILMDSDLQDDPAAIPQFVNTWRSGYDVVFAIREARKESLIKRACYSVFYRLMRAMADVEIPLDSGDFCLMSRRIVDIINDMPERSRFVRGIRSWAGHSQIGIKVERSARYRGKPKYTISRLINLALDGLVSFSFLPLRAINLLGIFVSLVSVLLGTFYAVKRLFVGLTPPGFATTVVLILSLAGVQLLTLGVIGEYIGRICVEVRRRPLYLIGRITRGK